MSKLEIGSSRTRWVILLIASLGFVAAGTFIVATGESPAVGWLNVVFFGACALVFFKVLLESGPRLVIDDAGVLDRTLGVGVIEWRDIEGAELRTIHDTTFIGLHLRDAQKYTRRLTPVMQRLAELNTKLGFQELSLNLTGVDADPIALYGLLLREIAVRGGAAAPAE